MTMIDYKEVAKNDYKTFNQDESLSCVRIPGEITCCGRRAFLSRWNETDSVRQVCGSCDEFDRVSHPGFANNECFQVACPNCRQPMGKFINEGLSNKYSFECERCGHYYKASDFLPELL